MKKILVILIAGILLIGCSPKPGDQGPTGPQGSQGPVGPSGPGYSQVVLQPGPGDTKGKDNTIGPTTGNNGTQPTVVFGYSSGVSNPYRALMYFDVTQAGLPAGATIVDAILTLYPQYGSTAGNILTAEIYPISRSWTETGSTWTTYNGTNNWTTSGGDYIPVVIGSFSVDPTTTAKITVHLNTSYVQNWVNGQINYGFIVKSINEGSPDAEMAVYSRDYTTDTTKRPSLVLIYK